MATYIKAVCAECSSSLPCGGCQWYCAAAQPWIVNSGNLPSTINFYGTSLSLSGTSYGNTTNGVILEESNTVWAVYVSGVRTTYPVLYSTNVSDYFNSTYTLTLTGTPNTTVTLTRVGCEWVATQTIDGQVWNFRLSNESGCGAEDLGWTLLGVVPSSPLGNLFIVYKLDEDSIPITQGTPTGSYAIGIPKWSAYVIS
jgi:hypothetical protein